MREIEVKAKVNDVESIITNLRDKGCVMGELIMQSDSIYIDSAIDFLNVPLGTCVLRVRETKKGATFTLKRSITNELDCIEKQVNIDDPVTMNEILVLLGLKKAVNVVKKRVKTKYDNYNICLDIVENLGEFIEIEALVDEDEEHAQDDMFKFLSDLGVGEIVRVKHGYDTLLYRKETAEVS